MRREGKGAGVGMTRACQLLPLSTDEQVFDTKSRGVPAYSRVVDGNQAMREGTRVRTRTRRPLARLATRLREKSRATWHGNSDCKPNWAWSVGRSVGLSNDHRVNVVCLSVDSTVVGALPSNGKKNKLYRSNVRINSASLKIISLCHTPLNFREQSVGTAFIYLCVDLLTVTAVPVEQSC